MFRILSLLLLLVSFLSTESYAQDDRPVRVFIFAGQSNMVGSDSKVQDIANFPPFVGLEKPQSDVRFSYSIGRDTKFKSEGWVDLQPVNNVVGPELSFARAVSKESESPIAIIKCAAGGTHLGGDWNPDLPEGFKMYPLTLELIRTSLAEFDRQKIPYRIEGFMWHQGENDMFNETYMAEYGKNLMNFMASWRRDLKSPELKFYVGELCTKTIWGMDLRPRMHAISIGQKAATLEDDNATYIPTSHHGVEIGGGVGLHYHYGTLGQLEHGVAYANAYLANIGKQKTSSRPLKSWPYLEKSKIKLFVMAGHRNMEGERAFRQSVPASDLELLKNDPSIAFKYDLGGGARVSDGWEPLGQVGLFDTFGPELSFASALKAEMPDENIAIGKFTHSGSQMNDWTPAGSMATSRHIYPKFIEFIKQSIRDLENRGHEVELAGIFYHVGENEMSMASYRKSSSDWMRAMIESSRKDLGLPHLRWSLSQQLPTDHKSVNGIDVLAAFKALADADKDVFHFPALDLPPQKKQLVIDSPGIIWLGREIAKQYLGENLP
ncbi:MAG: hypothetical protein ACI87E_004521 [Mariniblastus sp.]|jgi:hypothetical protein